MSHPCSDSWRLPPYATVNRVLRLKGLVDNEDARQAQNGFDVGGWAYWLRQEDFGKFRDCYMEVCRALNTVTVPPGEWTPPPPPPLPPFMLTISNTTSSKLGMWSQLVIEILSADENDQDGLDPPNFVHPGHGMHGWLGTGPYDPMGYAEVEDLFTSMRNALDR